MMPSLLWIISTIILLHTISIIGLILIIILENRNPVKSIAWVTMLIMLPGLGLIFYFFFGQDNRRTRIISFKTYKRIKKGASSSLFKIENNTFNNRFQQLQQLLLTSNAPAFSGSEIKTFTNGKDKINALLQDIKNAKQHIHIQYYIFIDDEVGNQVIEALIEKASQAVEVRFIYDGVGSWDLKRKTINRMKKAGIQTHGFLNVVFPKLTSKINYRNHRKIVVIDGTIGYMGGMNIAKRYKDGFKWGTWKDLHFRITGPGTLALQETFMIDWYAVSKQMITSKAYFPKTEALNQDTIQIIASGPTGIWRTLLQTIIFAISNAKKYVYIQTPYLIPPDPLNVALQTAARAGIDVRIMLPHRADSKSVHLATRSFIEEMLRAGVSIYLYQPGFLHSKLLIIDNELSCIGSANMDFRSFENNFEISAFVYSKTFASTMHDVFFNDRLQCKKLDFATWIGRTRREKIKESFMRLFSPLL